MWRHIDVQADWRRKETPAVGCTFDKDTQDMVDRMEGVKGINSPAVVCIFNNF